MKISHIIALSLALSSCLLYSVHFLSMYEQIEMMFPLKTETAFMNAYLDLMAAYPEQKMEAYELVCGC